MNRSRAASAHTACSNAPIVEAASCDVPARRVGRTNPRTPRSIADVEDISLPSQVELIRRYVTPYRNGVALRCQDGPSTSTRRTDPCHAARRCRAAAHRARSRTRSPSAPWPTVRGLRPRAVYSLFGAKEGLLDALAERGFETLGQLVQALPRHHGPDRRSRRRGNGRLPRLGPRSSSPLPTDVRLPDSRQEIRAASDRRWPGCARTPPSSRAAAQHTQDCSVTAISTRSTSSTCSARASPPWNSAACSHPSTPNASPRAPSRRSSTA